MAADDENFDDDDDVTAGATGGDAGAGAVTGGGTTEGEAQAWYEEHGFGEEWKDKDPLEAAKHYRDQHKSLSESFEQRFEEQLAAADEYYQNKYDLDPEFRAWKESQAAAKTAPPDPEKPWLEVPEYDPSWSVFDIEKEIYGDPDETGKRPVTGKERVWTGPDALREKYIAAQKHRGEMTDKLLHQFPQLFEQGFKAHHEKAFDARFEQKMKDWREAEDLNAFEERHANILYAHDEAGQLIVDRTNKPVYSNIGQKWVTLGRELHQKGIASKKEAMVWALRVLKGELSPGTPSQPAKRQAAAADSGEPVDPDKKRLDRKREFDSRSRAAKQANRGGSQHDDDQPKRPVQNAAERRTAQILKNLKRGGTSPALN